MLSSISIIQKARIASSLSITLSNFGLSVLRRLAAPVNVVFAAMSLRPRCNDILSRLATPCGHGNLQNKALLFTHSQYVPKLRMVSVGVVVVRDDQQRLHCLQR